MQRLLATAVGLLVLCATGCQAVERRVMGEVPLADVQRMQKGPGGKGSTVDLPQEDKAHPKAHLDVTHLVKDLSDHDHPEHPSPKDATEVHEAASQSAEIHPDDHQQVLVEKDPSWEGREREIKRWKLLADSAPPRQSRNYWVGHKDAHDTYVVPRLLREQPAEIGAHHGKQPIRGHAYSHRRNTLEKGDTPAPIRIKAFYDTASIALLSAEKADFLKNQVMPKAVSYLESILSVREPVVGALKLPKKCTGGKYYQVGNKIVYQCKTFTDSCIDGYIPEEHYEPYKQCTNIKYNDCTQEAGGGGVTGADYLIYVSAKQTTTCPYCTDGASCDGTIAYAGTCIQDSGTTVADTTDRPLAGGINFCPGKIDPSANLDVQVAVAVHEVIHSMGFSSFAFPWWRDENNTPRTPRDIVARPVKDGAYYTGESTLKTFQESGYSRNKIVTPKVKQVAAEHFGCGDVNGLEIEDDGGAGTAGSHWEERVMNGDTMVGYSHPDSVVSPLTLALLEDTGWYVPDYDKAGWLDIGRGKGCDFLYGKCANPLQSHFQEVYCDAAGTAKKCTRDFSAVGVCSGLGSFAFDDCVAVVGYSNRDCSDPTLQNSNLTKWGWNYGASSFCVGVSPVVKISNHNGYLLTRQNQGAMCARMICRQTLAGATQLYVKLADQNEVLCQDGQMTSFAGTPMGDLQDHFVQGELDCPASSEWFCQNNPVENDGKVGCPAACNGRGDCVDGACVCFPGFSGDACGNGICTNPDFVCPTGTLCNRASGLCDALTVNEAAAQAAAELATATQACDEKKAAADACTGTCDAEIAAAGACDAELETYQAAADAADAAADAANAAAEAANDANSKNEEASSKQQTANQQKDQAGTPTAAERRTTGGTPCKIPFEAGGETYYDCTPDLVPDGKEYCMIDKDNRLFPCAPALTAEEARQRELALRGEFTRKSTSGKQCELPFYVGGKEYTDCTTDRSSGCEWCVIGRNGNRIRTGCCDPERTVDFPEEDFGEPCKWPVEYPSGSGQRYRDCSEDMAPAGQAGTWCVYEPYAGSYALGRCKPIEEGDVGYVAPPSQVSGMRSTGMEDDDSGGGDGEETTQSTQPGYTPQCSVESHEARVQHAGHLYHTCPVSVTSMCDELFATTSDVQGDYTGIDGEKYSYSIPSDGVWFREAKPLQGNTFSGDWWTLPFRPESFLGVLTPFTDYAYVCVFDRLYVLDKMQLDYLRDDLNANSRNVEVTAASYGSSGGGLSSLTKSFQYFIWLPPPDWVECFLLPNATDYRGSVARTKTGDACLPWDSDIVKGYGVTPDNYPDAGLGAHNFCRNPTGEELGAWCFVNSSYPAKGSDYCDVGTSQPRCWFADEDAENQPGTGSCTGSDCDDLGVGSSPEAARRRALRRRLLSGEDGNAQVASKDLTPTKGLDDPQMVSDILISARVPTASGGMETFVITPSPEFNGKRALYNLVVYRSVSRVNITVDLNTQYEATLGQGAMFEYAINASAPPPSIQDIGNFESQAPEGSPDGADAPREVGVAGNTVSLAGTGSTTINVVVRDAGGVQVPPVKVYKFVVSYAADDGDQSSFTPSFDDAPAPEPEMRRRLLSTHEAWG